MKRESSVARGDLAIARGFGYRLRSRCGPAKFELTLVGSRARGDADEESDADLFVALDRDGPTREVKDVDLQIACDLTLESGMLVPAFVADGTFLGRHEGFSFLDWVQREAVPV